MRPGSYSDSSPSDRPRGRREHSSSKVRKSKLRRLALEGLEPRTLLSTLPAPAIIGRANVSSSDFSTEDNSDESTPSIAVDPTNPLRLAAVWTRWDTDPDPDFIGVEGAFSTNGGASWFGFTVSNSRLTDPTSAEDDPQNFARETDATAAFDNNGNLYVLTSQHSDDNGAGALLLNKFDFTGASPSRTISNRTVHAWAQDPVLLPTLAVDTTGGPADGNLYVAWVSNDDTPPDTENWNPNAIRITASSDGGQNFSGVTTVSDNGNFGDQRNTVPRMAIAADGRPSLVWDDFGSGADAGPPFDIIEFDRLTAARVITADLTTGPITDDGTTTYTVDVPAGLTIADLDVRLVAVHNALGELTIQLERGGTVVQLTPNLADEDGLGGEALGIGTGGRQFGAIFDQESPRSIADASEPYIGRFRPNGGNLGAFYGTDAGGTWTLTIIDDTATTEPGPRSLIDAELIFTAGLRAGPDRTVNVNSGDSAQVRGTLDGGGTIGSPAMPRGIGPAPTIAADTTADGPNRGRIYVAYTDRDASDDDDNPTDNTDIFLAYTDDGGLSWIRTGRENDVAGRVNDDRGDRDGFSGADLDLSDSFFFDGVTSNGRPQFMPQVAVDQQTGALAVSFYDARHDASRGRVATYLAVSVDGGETFAPQTFVNEAEVVFDVATGTNRVVGPIPDNAAQGNTVGTFSYGHRQGLAALGGNIYTAWSGNINGGPNGEIFLDIRAARAVTAAGPRIVDGTAGVVGTTVDGTPVAREFVVTFDRPIDPTTFSTDDVAIRFLSPDRQTSEAISATNVVALDSMRFRVEFPPQSRPGTYSYSVGPNITDLLGNRMDQDADATAGEAQQDRFAAPRAAAGGAPLTGPFVRETLPLIVPGPRVVETRAVRGDGAASTGGTVLDGTVVGVEVVFDRNMEGDTFTVDDVLRIVGPAGEVDRASFEVEQLDARTFRITFAEQQLSGTYQVLLGSNIQSVTGYLVDSDGNAGVDVLRGGDPTGEVELSFASTVVPRAIPANGSVESTLVVDKAFTITDVDLQLNIAHANVPDLRAELIAPDGRVVLLFDGVGNTGDRANFTNTIFDDAAAQTIADGTPPFSDRYRPQGLLSVLNDANGDVTEAGTYTLRITNSGGVAGTLNSWRLIMKERVTGTGLGEPVADRIRADFRIFTMDPTDGLSSSTWTPIGPAPIESGEGAGRVTAIAVDPSDVSGNTVYIGAASGGVWKTNNFLTLDSEGPTWIPLTDAVATNGLNVGSIAVFGRNNDPNQSIVMVATGEGDTGTPGVGFLRSTDGGSTWELYDSADNTVPFAQRGREFVGTTAFKVVADPKPTSTGQAIFYAALSGGQGGLWRSTNSGDTWQRLRAGQATDLLLDPGSGTPSVNNPTGNLQVVYAGFRDEGVFISPNQGQQFNLMPGGVGKPRVRDGDGFDPPPIPVTNQAATPNGNKGRIVLTKPALTGDARQDLLYQGWLYAAVATDGNTLDGLYLTKDQGQNWTRMELPTEPVPDPSNIQYSVTPTNDISQANYDPTAPSNPQGNPDEGEHQLANYALALTVDPTNPNVVYLGGTVNGGGETALIRVDSTFVHDPHAFYLSNDLPGGPVRRNYVDGPAVIKAGDRDLFPGGFDPRTGGTINLYRDPADPLDATATVLVNNTASFSNSGAGVRWTPFDEAIGNTTDLHQAFSLIDPLTGHGRLIFGVDRGIFTGVDAGDGTLLTQVGLGNTVIPTGSRNGNLQTAQIYFGAVQPSQAAADVAGALFYAQTDGNGFPRSSPEILETGNLDWSSPRLQTEAGSLSGSGVEIDPTGSGASFQYNWRSGGDAPKFPGGVGPDFRTDFFLVDVTPANGNPHDVVGRTSGLIQTSVGAPSGVPDPQWPFPNRNAVIAGAPGGANFAVNPINADQIVINAPGDFNGTGRIFRTLDRGLNWLEIGLPSVLGNSYFPALAFGAPEPGTQPGNVGDYIIGGNAAGQVYATFTGGGAAGDQWIPLNNGDLEGNTSPFRSIVTNPIRGTYEAYAVTNDAVYHIADTRSGTWTDITANLFSITHNIFGDEGFEDELLGAGGIRSLTVDWRYAIPNDIDNPPSNPTDPTATHPVLYVGGVGGVFASYNDGGSWLRFPSAFPNSINTTPEVPGAGGGLPVVEVRDLDLSLGNINRATGLPINQAGDPNLLMASTFGRGAFAIRLGPVVFPESLRLVLGDERIPAGGQPPVISPSDLIFEGFSAQSAAGNAVRLRAFEIGPDDQILGELPLVDEDGAPVVPTTDSAGYFTVRIAPGALTTAGPKRIGIQAEQGGTTGNIALFELVVNVPAPALVTESDTGRSDSDRVTNDTTPTFRLNTADGQQIELFRRAAGTTDPYALVGGPDGTGLVTDEGPDGTGVPNGVYEYAASIAGIFSDPLVVTIDAERPAAPDAPVQIADDVPSTPNPTFTIGGVEPNAEVRLYRFRTSEPVSPTARIVGSAIAGADGVVTIQDVGPLTDGDYEYWADQVDLAGNASPQGPRLTVLIRGSEVQPPAVSLDLEPADDTGQPGDNITANRRPRLIGTTSSEASVQLIDGDGNPLADPIQAGVDGAFILEFPAELPDGTYTVRARVIDTTGNLGLSDPLVLTVDTTAPAGISDLGLAPESDTGLRGDLRTSVRRPILTGTAEPGAFVEIFAVGLQPPLASGTADAQGRFRIQVPGEFSNGVIELRARSRDVAGNTGDFGPQVTLTIVSAPGDFDNDGIANLALYRPGQASGESQFRIDRPVGDDQVIDSTAFQSSDPTSPLFGFELRPGDIPVTGDFDGDGIADAGVFRPDSDRQPGASEWFILGSRSGPRSVLFGGSGLDVPAVGDFDGDGVSDIAVFRPVSDLLPGAAEWFILPSSTGDAFRVSFGAAGGLDLPAVADFDGDGRDDIAVFRPDSDLVPGAAQWFFLPSSSNDLTYSQRLDGYTVLFGEGGVNQPVPADFDGDGRADIATYRPTTSEWFILQSGLPVEVAGQRIEFGVPGNIPAPGDYDGDGIADLVTFLPTAGRWTVRQSTDGNNVTTDFGATGDVPLLAPLAFRDPRPGSIANPNPPTAVAALTAGGTSGQARQVAAASTLDLGRQASRLANAHSARAEAVARFRAARADSADLPVGRIRGLLDGLLSRRLGNRPRA